MSAHAFCDEIHNSVQRRPKLAVVVAVAMAAVPPPEEGERQRADEGCYVVYVQYAVTVVPTLVYSSAGILVFKDKWLCRIILREKCMEIRGQRLKAGPIPFRMSKPHLRQGSHRHAHLR